MSVGPAAPAGGAPSSGDAEAAETRGAKRALASPLSP
jgi:hypothetical protein